MPERDQLSDRADCPYCDGTGRGDVIPGASIHAPCETCGGEGTLDAADACRLRARIEGDSMGITRHWLLRNVNEAVFTAVDNEANANAIRDAYPDAGIKVEGPFVPEAQLAGAVHLLLEIHSAGVGAVDRTNPDQRRDLDKLSRLLDRIEPYFPPRGQ